MSGYFGATQREFIQLTMSRQKNYEKDVENDNKYM